MSLPTDGEPLRHSPLPWKWVASTDMNNLGAFIAADGSTVCDFGDATQYYPTEGTEPSEADRILIVERVNGFDSLVRERYVLALRLLQSPLVLDDEEGRAVDAAIADMNKNGIPASLPDGDK